MRWLSVGHLSVPRRRCDSSLLSPFKQRHGHQQKETTEQRYHDMEIAQSHSVDPRCESEENNHRHGVPREYDTDQSISNNLMVHEF